MKRHWLAGQEMSGKDYDQRSALHLGKFVSCNSSGGFVRAKPWPLTLTSIGANEHFFTLEKTLADDISGQNILVGF